MAVLVYLVLFLALTGYSSKLLDFFESFFSFPKTLDLNG